MKAKCDAEMVIPTLDDSRTPTASLRRQKWHFDDKQEKHRALFDLCLANMRINAMT